MHAHTRTHSHTHARTQATLIPYVGMYDPARIEHIGRTELICLLAHVTPCISEGTALRVQYIMYVVYFENIDNDDDELMNNNG